MTLLETLALRCEEGEGADRELDALIWRWLCQSLPRSERWNFPPAYTASLDAAVSFVERALPGWDWCRLFAPHGPVNVYLRTPDRLRETIGAAPTTERAMIAAALRALAAKEQTT